VPLVEKLVPVAAAEPDVRFEAGAEGGEDTAEQRHVDTGQGAALDPRNGRLVDPTRDARSV
jgi:hypothetical protein